MTNVTLAVDLKLNGRLVPAGTRVDLDRVHAGNLVHRGLARHTGRTQEAPDTPQTPAPDPAAAETATSAAKQSKGKE